MSFVPTYQAGCSLKDPTGASGVTGYLWLTQPKSGGAVEYLGFVKGLLPGKHGFHTHTESDIADSCAGAGTHFNIDNKDHAGPLHSFTDRHRGAHGNIIADS